MRGRRVYALVSDVLQNDLEDLPRQHVLVARDAPLDEEDRDDKLIAVKQQQQLEHIEAIFENCLCRWEYVNDAIEKLAGTIDATRKLLELALDNERNRIERMQLYLSMAGLSFALMSAVGGFFGMNLVSGLETHPYMFNLALSSTFSPFRTHTRRRPKREESPQTLSLSFSPHASETKCF